MSDGSSARGMKNLHSAPVAIVTGAGRGIGRAVCVEQARRGWRLLMVARGKEQLAESAAACRKAAAEASRGVDADRYRLLPLDLAGAGAAERVVATAIDAFGRVDALVNNAAMVSAMDVEATTAEKFREVIELDLTVPFLLAREVWPIFRRQKGGVIVNISSQAARDPFEGFTAYSAAKAGLNMMSLSLAREGAALGIRVYAVAPGVVETAMLRKLFTPEQVPTERTLSPQEVAGTVAACLAGEAAAPSGQVIWMSRD